MLQRRITPAVALTKLEDLCSRSERCSYELMVKLRGWGISGGDAREIMDRLTDARYVDDARFARAYVRDKFLFSKWGRRKIRAALIAKRIPSGLIDEALESEMDDEAYLDNLLAVLRSRMKNMDAPLDFESRRKLAAFAVNRGYEPSLVINAIGQCHDDTEVD